MKIKSREYPKKITSKFADRGFLLEDSYCVSAPSLPGLPGGSKVLLEAAAQLCKDLPGQMLACHHKGWLPKPQTQLSPRWLMPHAMAVSRVLCCTRERRAGGRGCSTALLLAALLTHTTAIARSWNMNMCGMTLLFIINPCPTVGNRENDFPRLRRSSPEHLHQFLCLITLGTENNSRNCAGGTAFALFSG